ncbi:MAG TPA: GIY-YIG nuclease family protein [Thermoplasmatales archaeon]|nr:GIY-YIG nuclease family protein [Thermoplasmatales archaeon]
MKGSYVLLLHMPENRHICIGSLGEIYFAAGYYAYVGSAMNGIEKRVERHKRKEKRMRWHIDHLLAHARLTAVFFRESIQKEEQEIAEAFLEAGFSFIPHFGSGDSRCVSHLFYSQDAEPFHTILKNLHMQQML